MQFKQSLLRLVLILLPVFSFSQTSFLPQGDKSAVLLDRLEIRFRTDSQFNFSKQQPLSRQRIMQALRFNGAMPGQTGIPGLSRVDHYNLSRFFLNNTEYLTDSQRNMIRSPKPLLRNFFTTPANLFEVHEKDFDLVINPVLQLQLGKEKDRDQTLFQNSRGVLIRARIADKIGFASYLTENQERIPSWADDFVTARKAVPGAGFYKKFKTTGYDYFDARGYFTFNVTRYIDVAFGYDRNFIGNGYRSLFLSDFGNSNLFLKLNTRIWKINYQNLFMELQNADNRTGDRLIGKKYATLHHLDIGVTKWLNIGLFEGVIFGRPNKFDFSYLNPVIFYRSAEQQNGSFDNSIAGLDIKANLRHNIQLYGQLLLDEFLLSEIKNNRGWWANKWGIQLGAKYTDAFGISNLDLQAEYNKIRPFTYSHKDSVANYTHYNQPLAHPLGANFSEWIGIARYQPAPKWMLTGKIMAYTQGRDSSSRSFGSNIFLPNVPPFRQADFGYATGDGWKTAVVYASFLASWEWKENFFLELNAVVRKLNAKTPPVRTQQQTVFSLGFRWNMFRREFSF